MEKGVIFDKADYAGFWPRLAIVVIDSVFLAILALSNTFIISNVAFYDTAMANLDFLVFLVLAIGYLVEMKRRVGSFGNLLTKTRLVSVDGGRPGFFRMFSRLIFYCFGPIMLIADILWVTSDQNKQMLRDLFSGVYVVRRSAEPFAQGPVKYESLMVLGFSFTVRRVSMKG